MPLLKTALTTLEATKRALGVPQGTTSDDGLLTDLINAASRLIEERTGRKLVRRSYNGGSSVHSTTQVADEGYYIFSGDGVSGEHALPNYPVVSSGFVLESLQSRGSGGDTWSALTEYVDYVVDYNRGIVHFNGGTFAKGIRNYRITYTGGYAENTAPPFVPEDLVRACHEVIKGEYRDNASVTSETIAGWSRTYNSDKSNTLVEQTIERYKSVANFL